MGHVNPANREKRIIPIRIWIEKDKIQFELVTPNLNHVMNEWDYDVLKEVKTAQAEAKANSDKGSGKKGERIHTKDYTKEPGTPHPGIHLSLRKQDEILWFSNQSINFYVDIHRDPELILLEEDKPRDLVTIERNKGIDNPFTRPDDDFPLRSINGGPVLSGPLKERREVRDQRFYKYAVTVEGIAEPLDPHVEGHD